MKTNFKLVGFLLLPLFLMPLGLYAQQSNAAKQEQPSKIIDFSSTLPYSFNFTTG